MGERREEMKQNKEREVRREERGEFVKRRKRGKEGGGGRQKDWLLVVKPSPNGHIRLHLRPREHPRRRGGKIGKPEDQGVCCVCFLGPPEATPTKSHQCDYPTMSWTKMTTRNIPPDWMEKRC